MDSKAGPPEKSVKAAVKKPPAGKLQPQKDNTELHTANSQLHTENMEVHHHPELPHGEKKRFKEYILEGLMIFIAVTMGFFAESLREHINDHDKELQYIQTFAQDLRTDSLNMCESLAHLNNVRSDIHSLIMLLNSPGMAGNGARLYYYARVSTTNLTFHANDRTLTQLKNSGGFSLIKNKAVIDSITTYESQVDRYMLTNAIAMQEAQLLYPTMARLFNAAVFETMVTDEYNIVMPAGNPQLILKDPAIINQFIYYLHQRESTLIASGTFLRKVQSRNKSIYSFLKKGYELDN